MKHALRGEDAYNTFIATELPLRTDTYTPIGHAQAMFEVRKALRKSGFSIDKENYSCTHLGEVALISFEISYKEVDEDILLQVSFLNSYNKQFRFQFAMGAVCKVNMSSMFTSNADLGLFRRKHTGTAEIEASEAIEQIVASADMFWKILVKVKNDLKNLTVSLDEQYEMLGRLYFQHDALNTTQLHEIKKVMGMKKPPHNFGLPHDNAWVFYNRITYALREAHPKDWIKHHTIVHEMFEKRIPGWFGNKMLDITLDKHTEMKYPGLHHEVKLATELKLDLDPVLSPPSAPVPDSVPAVVLEVEPETLTVALPEKELEETATPELVEPIEAAPASVEESCPVEEAIPYLEAEEVAQDDQDDYPDLDGLEEVESFGAGDEHDRYQEAEYIEYQDGMESIEYKPANPISPAQIEEEIKRLEKTLDEPEAETSEEEWPALTELLRPTRTEIIIPPIIPHPQLIPFRC